MAENVTLPTPRNKLIAAVEQVTETGDLYWTKAIPFVGPDGGPFRPLTEYLDEMEDRIVQRVTRAITGHDDS
jgi:hypothetical protein